MSTALRPVVVDYLLMIQMIQMGVLSWPCLALLLADVAGNHNARRIALYMAKTGFFWLAEPT